MFIYSHVKARSCSLSFKLFFLFPVMTAECVLHVGDVGDVGDVGAYAGGVRLTAITSPWERVSAVARGPAVLFDFIQPIEGPVDGRPRSPAFPGEGHVGPPGGASGRRSQITVSGG